MLSAIFYLLSSKLAGRQAGNGVGVRKKMKYPVLRGIASL
jgi:hypothetical protein